MPVNFQTDNLNQRLYRKMIWYIIAELYQYRSEKISEFWKEWFMEIIPLSHMNLDYFKHFKTTSGQKLSSGIPAGHTGLNTIQWFLIDKNDWGTHRTNSDRIQHEICHAVLLQQQNFNTSSKDFVTIPHNESARFTKKFWYWNWNFSKLRFQLSIIDIRRKLVLN